VAHEKRGGDGCAAAARSELSLAGGDRTIAAGDGGATRAGEHTARGEPGRPGFRRVRTASTLPTKERSESILARQPGVGSSERRSSR
jgi:hypothetical protein